MRKQPDQLLNSIAAQQPAGAGPSNIQVFAHVHLQRKFFQHVHIASGSKNGGNNGPNTGTGNHIDWNVLLLKDLKHTDVRKSFCAARAQRNANLTCHKNLAYP